MPLCSSLTLTAVALLSFASALVLSILLAFRLVACTSTLASASLVLVLCAGALALSLTLLGYIALDARSSLSARQRRFVVGTLSPSA
jgi:hypothetical protein